MVRLKGALIDVDGTLLDSNDAHAECWVEVLQEAGHRVSAADVRPLIGMGGDKLLPRLTGIDADSERGKKLSALRSKVFLEKYLPNLQPFPSARELLMAFAERSLVRVVATSAAPDEVSALLRQARVHDLIEETTSSGDAKESKPAPDIIEVAIKRSGYPAGELCLLGDTPYDVEAGLRAGVRVVALRSGGWSDSDLLGAIAIYDGVADLLAKLSTSPFGDAEGQAWS